MYIYVCIYIYIYTHTHTCEGYHVFDYIIMFRMIMLRIICPADLGIPPLETKNLLEPNALVVHMRSLLGWLRLGWLKIAQITFIEIA